MSTRSSLVRLLSDGEFHSGTEMGRALGVSRAAVCKAVRPLREAGLEIDRLPGRGYRLQSPVVLLDKASILAQLGGTLAEAHIEIFDELPSTSAWLLERSAPSLPGGQVCLAEAQHQGRGRRGRSWVATPYHNILLSLSWRFDTGLAAMAGLSLAAGVAVVEALAEFGVAGVGLKWPNDILWQDRKLAGLLVEVRGEAAGPCLVVLGLGLNVLIAERDAALIEQPWIDLHRILGVPVDRNRLTAILLRHLTQMLAAFDLAGLEAFRERWERHHQYRGRPVRILRGDGVFEGVARGVDSRGALLVEGSDGRLQAFHAGEVSLRAA